jgi:hydroxymethylglutaryl-CoA lyase
MSDHVTLFEMGPRDGLQNEKTSIATADKIRLVNALSECGFRKIEVTSFVSPKWVPQMADATEVMAGITRNPSVDYAVLTPNMKGLDAALSCRPDEVAIFGSASEGFSQKNINCSIAESFERFAPVVQRAIENGVRVRGYVSCVTDCPYDGPTAPARTAHVAKTLLAMGCYEISLGDTIGAAVPDTVAAMLDQVIEVVPPEQLAGHFNDTHGQALDNIDLCLDRGLRVFDASVGGLGGCPYAPGAKGNVATEAVLYLLERRGFSTGIDRTKLTGVVEFAKTLRSA